MNRQNWVDYLNACLREDYIAINTLFDIHVIVSNTEDSNPITYRYNGYNYVTGCLGLINGMMAGYGGPIVKIVDDNNKIMRFE